MENAFASISAESDLRDMITLSSEEIEEANAWFDKIEDRWLDGAYEAQTEF